MNADLRITSVGRGMYVVQHGDSREVVYVAGPPGNRWIFWNGSVFGPESGDEALGFETAAPARSSAAPTNTSSTAITAPMPARVGRLNVQPGSLVAKGDILIVLEAMKMELPIRAPGDGRVVAVHCGEGELVQAEALLLEVG